MSPMNVKTAQGPQRCAYCHDALEEPLACPGCATALHSECWTLSVACVSPGCGHTPALPSPGRQASESKILTGRAENPSRHDELRERVLHERRFPLRIGALGALLFVCALVGFGWPPASAVVLPGAVLFGLAFLFWATGRVRDAEIVFTSAPKQYLLTVVQGQDRAPRFEDMTNLIPGETYQPPQALSALTLKGSEGEEIGPFLQSPYSLPIWLLEAREDQPVLVTGLDAPGELLLIEGEREGQVAALEVPAHMKRRGS